MLERPCHRVPVYTAHHSSAQQAPQYYTAHLEGKPLSKRQCRVPFAFCEIGLLSDEEAI